MKKDRSCTARDSRISSGIFVHFFLATFVFFSCVWGEPLRAILLLGDKDPVLSKEEVANRNGVEVFDVSLPGTFSDLKKMLSPFLGQDLNSKLAKEIEEKIYSYYQVRGYPFIVLSIVEKFYKTGVLQIFVEESLLGAVDVEGNRWTPKRRYTEYFKTKPGKPISTRAIASDVSFLNRNPFRNVNVLYEAGNRPNTTNITLLVEDRKPYRFYVGLDNTGVPTTGRGRVFAGFSWDQIFNLDQTFFYQYTTNYNVNKFHSNMFQYMAFLPWKDVLQIYGGFSIVHGKIEAPNRNNKGTNIQASLRYTVPFLINQIFSQEAFVGFDLKNTNNNMQFIDFTPTFGSTVNLSQLVVGYKCKYEKGKSLSRGGLEVYFSPGDWLPDQSNADFASLRPGAKNQWIYGLFYCNYRYELPYSCSYVVDLRGQLSSATLLPSEQLGMGGYDTVRGYDERQYNADNGFLASLEFHAPTFSIPTKKERTRNRSQSYFLLFLDGGLGFDKTKIPGFHVDEFLLSAGPGFRCTIPPYFNARVDWGVKLHHQDGFTGGWSMFHFSVIGSY